jgi:hypothetical protein
MARCIDLQAVIFIIVSFIFFLLQTPLKKGTWKDHKFMELLKGVLFISPERLNMFSLGKLIFFLCVFPQETNGIKCGKIKIGKIRAAF